MEVIQWKGTYFSPHFMKSKRARMFSAHYSNFFFFSQAAYLSQTVNISSQKVIKIVLIKMSELDMNFSAGCNTLNYASSTHFKQEKEKACSFVAQLIHSIFVAVSSVPDVLFHFISAGGCLRLEVKKCNPGVEGKSNRWWGWTGEASVDHTLFFVQLSTFTLCFFLSVLIYRVNAEKRS